MVTPIWLSIQNACEIAKFAGIQGPYSVRLTTANAEALIEELKSIGKPAEIVWRVGEQLLSMRAAGIEVVIDNDAAAIPVLDAEKLIGLARRQIDRDAMLDTLRERHESCPKCPDGKLSGKINGGLKCDRCPHEIPCF